MEDKLIIGITGHPASGKDTIADHLISMGFSKVSGGDSLRKEMQKLGIPIDRSHIHEFVKKMRKQHGNAYLAKEQIKSIKNNTVISGVRNLEELYVFRKKFGENFRLIAVQAPIEIRYERAKERSRIGDDISFERFKIEEEKEKITDLGNHEVDSVIKAADIVIENNKTPKDLFFKIDKFIESI